ncbi:MAG: hypothetical protein RLY24_1215, partial [Actinomycetota bacterium]
SYGNIVPLDADGNIRGSQGELVSVSLSGARPGETLNVWLFSTPVLIGQEKITEGGDFSGRFRIPENVEDGAHRLVLKLVSYTGTESTVSIGLLVGSEKSGNSTISTIIFATLGLAVAFALIIPATRRRRRRLQAA